MEIQLLVIMPHYYTNPATCGGSQDPRVQAVESLGLYSDSSLVAGLGFAVADASVASALCAQPLLCVPTSLCSFSLVRLAAALVLEL